MPPRRDPQPPEDPERSLIARKGRAVTARSRCLSMELECMVIDRESMKAQ